LGFIAARLSRSDSVLLLRLCDCRASGEISRVSDRLRAAIAAAELAVAAGIAVEAVAAETELAVAAGIEIVVAAVVAGIRSLPPALVAVAGRSRYPDTEAPTSHRCAGRESETACADPS